MKKSPSGHQTPNHSGKMPGELSISHILGTSDIMGSSSDNISFDLGYVLLYFSSWRSVKCFSGKKFI